jgi:RNA polymerase sigma factor (sigma-70 family)
MEECERHAQWLVDRLVSDPAKRHEYVLVGLGTAWELMQEHPHETAAEFLKAYSCRISGAIKDALRKEARVNALDAAMIRGFEPVLSQAEVGDLFEPVESRTRARRNAVAAIVASTLFSSTQWFEANDPETVLLETEEIQTLRATVRTALASLDPDDQALIHEIFYEKATLESAGERRGITKSAAYKRMRGALDRLEKRLRPGRD